MTEFLFLLGVAVLVAANGFFVAAEFALVRAREGRVEQMRDDGKRGAALVLRQIDRIDEYLSACQLGITIGEQVPKIFAIVHAERTAVRVARPLHWFRVAFSPLIWLLNTASNAILRLVGVDARAEFEEVSSSEDLKLIIARSQRGGKLDPGEAGMLSGVFHLHEQEARQVMTPIPAVGAVDAP